MTMRFWPVWGRMIALLGLGLFVAPLAWAQDEPPEPPGASEAPPSAAADSDQRENKGDRDNPPAEATERDAPRDRSADERPQPRDPDRRTFDDPERVRDAARETERGSRDSRDPREFDRDPRDSREPRDPAVRRDDSNTRYVPDPRPGRMSESQASGQFEVDRIRSADVGLWFDRSTADGLIINDIGTGAISRLGFREGDRIYSINGVRVDSEAAFVRTLFDPRWRDQRVNVIIYRHGRPWTVYVQPVLLVQEYTTVAYDPLDDWGLVLDDRYDDYVVVWRVRPRSPAFYAGLRAGDVIVNWQGRRLAGRDDFIRLASQGNFNDLALDINRNRQTRRIDLDLSDIRTSARTSLRPDFDADMGVRGSAAARAGAAPGADVEARPDVRTDLRIEPDVDRGLRTGDRVEGTIEGRPDARLFPRNPPSGTPDTRRGIFGPRRP
jgi:PDZ domain-containing protein